MTNAPARRDLETQVVALGLIAMSVLSIAVALNHPEPATRADATDVALMNIAGERGAIFGVHATLIALMLFTSLGVAHINRRVLGGGSLTTSATGLLAVSMLSMSLAAVVNGLAVPMWAAAYPVPLTPESDAAARAILLFAASLNRVFADMAVLLSSLALGGFGLGLVVRPGVLRWVGLLGLVIGAGVLAGLLGGVFVLDYHGFNLTNAALYLWVASLSAAALAQRRNDAAA